MTLSVVDVSGNIWGFDYIGNFSLNSGSIRYFDSMSFSVSVQNGVGGYYPMGSPIVSETKQRVWLSNLSDGVLINRDASVGDGFVRMLEVVKNTGTTAKTVTISLGENIYFDSGTRIAATSSGDGSYTTADDWYVVDSVNSTQTRKLVHVVSGAAAAPASASLQSSDMISTGYRLSLGAGETKAIMHFYALASDKAGAVALATDIMGLGSKYMAGLTDAEKEQLVNFTGFTVVSDTTAILTSGQSNLTLTGTAAIDGTGNANDNVITGNAAANTLSGLDGNDTLNGGGGNDSLLGGNGNDVLNGGAGNDTMAGGAGDDQYIVDAAGDVAVENANQGFDTIVSSVNYSIAKQLNIENIVLAGQAIRATGNANENSLVGNALDNMLVGGDGNDTLNGGAGTDTLNGGNGSDVYVVDTTGDIIIDSGGIDRVDSSVTFSLAELGNLENLTLTGSGNIDATGNALANIIIGNRGANVIDGGTGADTMKGGAGNDTYMVRDAGDTVTEAAEEGADEVISYVAGSYILAPNIENLRLAGTGLTGTGNAADNRLTGQAGDNHLFGLDGNDTLDGAGGNDMLDGGNGDDLYIVDAPGDTIFDAGGTDTVQSSVSYSLAALETIENLLLTGGDALSGTGNGLDNLIAANDGDSTIDGGGGFDMVSYAQAGAGVAVGLASGAQATGGSGTDTLTNVEAIEGSRFGDSLFGGAGGNVLIGADGNDSLDGGAGDDWLKGGTGNDTLTSRAGADTLVGGSGDDVYKVAGNQDPILIDDFSGVDTLDASGASGAVAIDLKPGSTSNINGRLVMLAPAGMVDSALDVMFLHDNADYYNFSTRLYNFKAAVPGLTAALSSIQADNRFGLASFTDKDRYVYHTDLALTDDPGALVAALNTMGVGNDYYGSANAQLEALMQVAVRTTELGFREGSFRVVVMATDSAYQQAGDSGYTPNDGDAVLETEDYPTIALLKAKLVDSGILPVFAVDSSHASHYTSLVNQLGMGVVVTLAGDNSNLVTAVSTGLAQLTQARIENAIGSAYGDTLMGNEAANRLEGKGGNDTYYVQGSEDTVVEEAKGGSDLVISAGSFTLPDNVENLSLTGTQDTNATGNSRNNQLVGNAGNNFISGGGGEDKMMGGWGNDTYMVDSAGDKIIEYGGAGIDTVMASVNHVLGNSVDNLTLTGKAKVGTGNELNNLLIGNDQANTLSGGAGNDTLSGGGGTDTLVGGEGSDKFLVNAVGQGIDRVADFVSGVDKIMINVENFDIDYYGVFNQTTKVLEADNFVTLAPGATTHPIPYGSVFIYHSDTGRLGYDQDGSNTYYREVGLLTLTGGKTLVASDIVAM